MVATCNSTAGPGTKWKKILLLYNYTDKPTDKGRFTIDNTINKLSKVNYKGFYNTDIIYYVHECIYLYIILNLIANRKSAIWGAIKRLKNYLVIIHYSTGLLNRRCSARGVQVLRELMDKTLNETKRKEEKRAKPACIL